MRYFSITQERTVQSNVIEIEMTAEANRRAGQAGGGLHKRMKGRHCLGILLSYYPCWFLFLSAGF